MTTAFVLQGPRQMGVISATAHYECVLGMREKAMDHTCISENDLNIFGREEIC